MRAGSAAPAEPPPVRG
jgi:pSer/pThr/pTyr-binding forkhead associated (FHA) protein